VVAEYFEGHRSLLLKESAVHVAGCVPGRKCSIIGM
jgi:hypothetical protein